MNQLLGSIWVNDDFLLDVDRLIDDVLLRLDDDHQYDVGLRLLVEDHQ
jgi:hypothetical protein